MNTSNPATTSTVNVLESTPALGGAAVSRAAMRYKAPVAAICLLLIPFAYAAESDYALHDYKGVEYRLSDYRGKWVVMNFWATWCPPCLEEMPELETFHAKHKDKDAVVWGIDFEEIALKDLETFLKKVSVSYPILGFGQKPYTPFGTVRVLPTTFFIGPDGKFVRKHEGTLTAERIEAIIAEHSNSSQ